MKFTVAIAFALAAAPAMAQPQQTVYERGQVWTGTGFQERTLVVQDGRFIDPASVLPDASRVALRGQYVTPAYANAHAHVTQASQASSSGYTDVGVFYVWNPNTVTLDERTRSFFGSPGQFRVKVAQGGITEPGGHPEKLYVDVLGPVIYGGRPREWFLGNAFHYGRTEAEIKSSLLMLKRQGADFVKIYLLRSEQYAVLQNDPNAYGAKGLNPANVPFLVQQAHSMGLPVIAHLETAHDLKVAAEAGVDYAGHLPAYGGLPSDPEAVRLTPEIARLVAQSGMRVIPTYALANGGDQPNASLSDEVQRTVEIQTENLALLRQAGVQILIGTDGFNQIFTEAEHLVRENGLSPHAVATMVFDTGPVLFPERRIGCFEPGCEADFLVLEADPTADISALRQIRRTVLAGVELPRPSVVP
ncbi:amidohydrolase family protein [Brevundimonas variabilis]|uniref:Imidazolonepropionase-like amidohydrolase n=1 Tax=Brevundimonas variabilis TaxID=74312 RepID=A0A7W9CFG7_9CAUL|nr:amidohydrolase family protein [Brevundimonas variabilis]MBB5744513.1 imidazolonepropionase-like amidohydrolase [Brevundimonas variabilis]